MKEMWYAIIVMLMLSILAGFASLSSPTTAFSVNLPPQWDFSTTEFSSDGQFELNLNNAFFDPDADPLSFSVSPATGVSAGVEGDTLVVIGAGDVIITASDGKSLTSQRITVYTR